MNIDCIKPASGPNVWFGSDLENDLSWLTHLTSSEVKEVLTALQFVKQLDVPVHKINKKVFPLPILGPRLKEIVDQVEHGRGFAVLRGIPVNAHEQEDAVKISWGLCSYLGRGIPQSREGDYVNHIIDLTDIKATTNKNLAHVVSRDELRVSHHGGRRLWHTDTADIVALLCLRKARSGGQSWLASAKATHNVILSEHPECLPALYEGYYYHRLADDQAAGTSSLSREKVPVFSARGANNLSCYYIPEPIQRAIDREKVEYSEVATRARDLIEEIPHRPEMKLTMDLEPGDLQIIDNRSLLHARADYEDWPELERRRHLLRLWLRVKQGRSTAAAQSVHSQFERNAPPK